MSRRPRLVVDNDTRQQRQWWPRARRKHALGALLLAVVLAPGVLWWLVPGSHQPILIAGFALLAIFWAIGWWQRTQAEERLPIVGRVIVTRRGYW